MQTQIITYLLTQKRQWRPCTLFLQLLPLDQLGQQDLDFLAVRLDLVVPGCQWIQLVLAVQSVQLDREVLYATGSKHA